MGRTSGVGVKYIVESGVHRRSRGVGIRGIERESRAKGEGV